MSIRDSGCEGERSETQRIADDVVGSREELDPTSKLPAHSCACPQWRPPEIGIKGNSHMLTQDKNNAEIADVIHKWLAGKGFVE